MAAHIQTISFRHYKAFENFRVDLDHINILTGSNNAGKSTVLGSLRVLAVALRVARKSKPERIIVDGTQVSGYRIKEAMVPISLENVATNYRNGNSSIGFLLTNGNSLKLVFDRDAGCVLIPESQERGVRTAADFKALFPLSLTVIPVLGPVEHKETLKELETVTSSLSTHRASRHFRSYWYHFPDGFDEFAEMVQSTWPGMRIQPPEISGGKELSMFVSEDRIDREIYWVGFGFQIWCQLLTHLHRAEPSTMIVIDEPEVYLHPEIQRKLLHVLKGTGADILVATHSIEIVSEAEPQEVLIIDKRKTHAIHQSDNRRTHQPHTSLRTRSAEAVSTTSISASRNVDHGMAAKDGPGLHRSADLGAYLKQAADQGGRKTSVPDDVEGLLGAECIEWKPEDGRQASLHDDVARAKSAALNNIVSAHTPVDSSQEWDSSQIELPKVGESTT